MESKEQQKQEIELLLRFFKKMQKLPIHCRNYQIKQFIHLIDCNIQYNDRHDDCYCE